MSFFQRAKEVTGDLASASKRKAQEGKLELEIRRLESKVGSEKDAIGQAVYPLIASGALQVDLPEVQTHMTAITSLEAEIADKRAEIESLNQPDPETETATAPELAEPQGPDTPSSSPE